VRAFASGLLYAGVAADAGGMITAFVLGPRWVAYVLLAAFVVVVCLPLAWYFFIRPAGDRSGTGWGSVDDVLMRVADLLFNPPWM
jgi:hypothetical protein